MKDKKMISKIILIIFLILPISITSASDELDSASREIFNTSLAFSESYSSESLVWRKISQSSEDVERLRGKVNSLYKEFLESKGQFQPLNKSKMVLITHQNSDLEGKTREFVEQEFHLSSEDIVILASDRFKVREKETLELPSQILFSSGGEIILPELQASDFHIMGGFVQLCLLRSVFDILKLTKDNITITFYTDLTYASFGHLKDWQVRDGLIHKIWRKMRNNDNLDTNIEELNYRTTFLLKNEKRSVRLHFQDRL
jgi:hypothetical protein